MAIDKAIEPFLNAFTDIDFESSATSIAKYAQHIIELDKVQRDAAFSAVGWNKEQKSLVFGMEDAAKAVGNITVAQFDEIFNLEEGTTAKLLNAQATDQMTTSMVLNAAAQDENIAEQLKLTAATNAQTIATEAQTAANTAWGASIKAAGKAMLATPIGWISLALTILPLVAKGIGYVYDKLVETAEEARETADELHSVFEETTSQLENLNSELETSKDRLKELQSLSNAGTITLVEQEELNNLREEVALLERRKDVLEEQAANDAKNANEALEHAFRKQKSQSSSEHDDIFDFMIGKNTVDLFKPTYEEYINALLESYKAMDDLDLSEMSEEQIVSLEKLRAELVNVASDLQENWIDQFEGEGEFKDELERIFNSIYKEINPAEYFTGSLESLPKALSEKLSELGSKGELTGESVSALAEDFTELSSWMEDSMYTADEVAAHFNALSRAQAKAGDSSGVYSAQLSELTDVMSELKSSYDILESAQSDMENGGGLSADTIKKLADAEENYLDYLYEENGVVKLNTEAWKENANAKMLGEMDEIQKEIDSLEERNNALRESIQYYHEQQVLGNDGGLWSGLIAQATVEIEENNKAIAENQGKLAIYSSLYGSITGDLDAYTSALQNFSNIANTIDSITSSFQTLANLQAEVANGFTMSLDKALEFAKVYPEIMNNAQVAADGQITLNEDVVNSFIEGKQAELDAYIDAQIVQLETDKEVWQAKMEAAQAQLDLAKAVAEGEGEITKELAEYRINAGNAVAQALIDAGVDEATAFRLAAAAMAQNAEEFDRVAMEVCTDVNGNFNQAAYDLAQTMYNNLTNVQEKLADVAKQAHQTAAAIAGMANGTIAGSAAIIDNGSGGVSGGDIKLSLTSGSFEGHEYTYTAKESGLEDFISQIELDISNYQSAINQIDGQIAALQALEDMPLESFQSSSGNSSSGTSQQEVEEYIATIDEYREIVERLRKTQEETERLETEIDNAVSYGKKIALQKELIAAYREEQDALHALNNARNVTITQGVKSLRELGFAVEYNADTNELWIDNMEYLNELTADSIGEYSSLQEATNALREGTEDLIDMITDLNDSNREGSATWQELSRSIIETTVSMYENAVQARENTIMLAENGMNNAINAKSLADVKKFSSSIIAEYQGMQKTIHEETEYYRSLGYSDTSDEVSKLSDLWWDYADNIKDVKQQVIDYLIEIVDAAHDSVDEIQSVSDVLYDAADEFAANDGFITVDTYQALLKFGPQYMQMLKDENGLWQINEERINAVIAARTRQLAVENAMAYVERIKLAAQEGSIEDINNLIFATTDATNSTWGLVYAELELMHTMGDLNDSQYQAALHNIQAMQDLAENAVQNIGKATDSVAKNLEETRKQLEDTKSSLQDLLDELEDMKDGADDLVKYVMDMLKHRTKQQIDLLEEMKDKYSEIIQLKKDSLDTTKDEQDYQKEISKKLKEMAKLQERINALSMDDSRSAQAERAKLLEEMAELQEDLADTQADKSIEAQKEALDQMEEDYHAEKDEEIKILEDSISSTQKLYDMSIEYIRNNWDTLYFELIAWNTEYGTSLNSEIAKAWDAAQAAAQRYGDFVTAIMGGISAEIDSITKQIESLDEQMSNLNSSTTSENKNTVVSDKSTSTEPTNEERVATRIKEMYQNAQKWHTALGQEQVRLDERNMQLGAELNALGIGAERKNGTWFVNGEKLFEWAKRQGYLQYHTGGFVGDDPLKPNEQYIKTENGELVLTSNQQDSIAAQIDRIGAMTEKLMGTPMLSSTPSVAGGLSRAERSTINNITNNSRPVEVHFGDTIINGARPDAVEQHKKLTESMVNDFARLTGVKW